jgi:hypothetical protein
VLFSEYGALTVRFKTLAHPVRLQIPGDGSAVHTGMKICVICVLILFFTIRVHPRTMFEGVVHVAARGGTSQTWKPFLTRGYPRSSAYRFLPLEEKKSHVDH